jgi:rhamnogalacturonan endolyase
MGVVWQNSGYNQPPHLGYYLPDYINGKIDTGISNVCQEKSEEQHDAWYTISGQRLNGKPSKSGLYIHGNRKVISRLK